MSRNLDIPIFKSYMATEPWNIQCCCFLEWQHYLIEIDAGQAAFAAPIDKNVLEDAPTEELRAYRELLEGKN